MSLTDNINCVENVLAVKRNFSAILRSNMIFLYCEIAIARWKLLLQPLFFLHNVIIFNSMLHVMLSRYSLFDQDVCIQFVVALLNSFDTIKKTAITPHSIPKASLLFAIFKWEENYAKNICFCCSFIQNDRAKYFP